MKKIILLFVSVIFLLVSCNDNKGINVPTSDSINEIKVEKLFDVDGKRIKSEIFFRKDGTQWIEIDKETLSKVA